MRVGVFFFLAIMATACVSKRERRQSAFEAEHTRVDVQRDTRWHRRQQGSYTVQLVEVEEWNRYTDTLTANTLPNGSNTVATGRNTVPTVSSYRRTRSITFGADSNTVTTGRYTDSSMTNTFAAASNTVSSDRKTFGPSGYMWLLGMVLVLVAVVYGVYRKVFR